MWWLLACAGAPNTDPPDPVDSAEAPAECGTWEDVGHPFVLTWCAACHSSEMDLRAGAPIGVDLETVGGVRKWADRVSARVGAGDMPPGGGPSAAEREAVLAWLACGAPGEDTRITAGAPPGGLLDAGVLSLGVEEEGASVFAEMGLGVLPLFSFEYVRSAEGAATWLGWSRYTDGELVEAIRYSPPLPLYQLGATTWSAETTADVNGAAEAQSWTFTRAAASNLDARVGDTEAEELVAIEAGGETHRWYLSEAYGSVLETHARPAGEESVLLYGTRPMAQELRGFTVAAETGGSGWYWSREVP